MDPVNGWTSAPTETLLATRANLLRGLRRVYDHLIAGDVHDIHPGHSSSPATAGSVTWFLLEGCEAELRRRNALMPTLRDLFPADDFYETDGAGYIRVQDHPTLPLAIANYTEKAAYEGVWTPVTKTCRGLIYNLATWEIVARPWPKFMNYGQAGAPDIDLNTPVCVTDKADGSLGILYPTPDGWAVATRGSFTSDQALHATEILRTRYRDFEPDPRFTVLVEIVYPANRIVLDYGAIDDLILLGAVNIVTGRSIPPTDEFLSNWTGPRTEVFDYRTFGEALAAEPRPNAEGLVVQILATDERVKLKQADYVELHKIVTGLNARTVWEHLVDGKPLDELIAPLPDEFHGWVKQVAEDITTTVDEQETEARKAFEQLRYGACVAAPDRTVSRKDLAIIFKQHPMAWALFALLDGKDIQPKLLRNAKPEAHVTPSGRVYTEENA